LYWSQEAVSPTQETLDVDESICGLSEAVAKSLRRGIQGVVEIDEGVLRPELPAKLLARAKFTGL
jgi:hypothetical protein